MTRTTEDGALPSRAELRRDEQGLFLTDGHMTVRADFANMLKRIRPQNLSRELLVRAAHIKGASEQPLAIDATAGLGDDSLLLAAAGFQVELFEKNPVIAALLEDALMRAAEHPDLAAIAARMHLTQADSAQALPQLPTTPDVVLLDPMFPTKTKSAQAKKKLQLLQQLEQPCDDEQRLLDAALAAHPRKVIIKRPVKGPFLAGRKPDYSLQGKAIRFDVIVG